MRHYENIPIELKDIPRWVCVKGSSKLPMQARVNEPASSSDPATWSSFDEARAAVDKGYYDDVGFVFADDGIVGVDIDDGFDEDGFLSPLSIDCMKACRSYTERSRSGRGIHILVRGTLPFGGRNNRKGCEIYRTGRYFITTGDRLIYPEIIENQSGIDRIVATYFPEVVRDGEGALTPRIYTPIWTPPENGRIRLDPVYPPVYPGSRNICMTSLAGQLHRQGYDREMIYREVCRANREACMPPLPDREIQTLVSSVTRYRRCSA